MLTIIPIITITYVFLLKSFREIVINFAIFANYERNLY